jgi:hypothetical protein
MPCALPQGILMYNIRAICILVLQQELLVMHLDQKDPSKPLALKLYRIPDNSTSIQAQDMKVTWPHSVHTIATPSLLLHVSISAVPSSTNGEDVATELMAHVEPPPVLVFVVM